MIEQHSRARLQCEEEFRQDLDSARVRPVVKDPAEVLRISKVTLRGKETVCSQFD